MPKSHKSGLMTSNEAKPVDFYLVASHYYPINDHDLGTVKDVTAMSFNNYTEALEMAKKLAHKYPEEKIYVFRAMTEVVDRSINVTDISW